MASVAKREWIYNGEKKTAWVVRYTDGNNKRRMKTFERKKDAETFRLQTEVEIKEGTHLSDADAITLNRALDIFLQAADRRATEAGGIRENTAYHWRLMANKHVRAFIGETKLNKVTVPLIQNWLNRLAYEEEEARGKPPLEKALQVVRLTLAEMTALGDLPRNPLQGASLRIPGSIGEPVMVPSKDEVKALLGASEGLMRPLLQIAVFAGLRKSEILALDWQSVDLRTGVIHVKRSASKTGKFQPTRAVPVSDLCKYRPGWYAIWRHGKRYARPQIATSFFRRPLMAG